MNVLVNGSSVSRGPGSWPYQIQTHLGQQPINLSQSAAGVTYIYETTIEELSKRDYDLVLIMWPPFDRWEYRVSDITKFSDTTYTTRYQKTINDWPEKIVLPINDQDYVDDNWVFGEGHQEGKNNEPVTAQSLHDLFHGYFQHVDYHSQSITCLTKIIGLQSFLKTKNLPYVFGWNRLYRKQSRFDDLYALLDWDQFLDVDLLSLAKKYNDYAEDGFHPGVASHVRYGDMLLDKIKQLYPDLLPR